MPRWQYLHPLIEDSQIASQLRLVSLFPFDNLICLGYQSRYFSLHTGKLVLHVLDLFYFSKVTFLFDGACSPEFVLHQSYVALCSTGQPFYQTNSLKSMFSLLMGSNVSFFRQSSLSLLLKSSQRDPSLGLKHHFAFDLFLILPVLCVTFARITF